MKSLAKIGQLTKKFVNKFTVLLARASISKFDGLSDPTEVEEINKPAAIGDVLDATANRGTVLRYTPAAGS